MRTGVLITSLLLAMNAGCIAPGLPPLETVDYVEIDRYTGKWYEIAKYPTSFERGCVDVTAEYTLRDDGTLEVLNTCGQSDGGSARTIEGFATVADRQTNAKLTVYFFYPFGAPYWIIDLDPDYRYAVVGEPSRQFLWILSRTPALDDETYAAILARLAQLGYDPARLEVTPQSQGGGG